MNELNRIANLIDNLKSVTEDDGAYQALEEAHEAIIRAMQLSR